MEIKRYFTIFTCFLFAQYMESQSDKGISMVINGTVVGTDDEPIKGAVVFVDSTKTNTKTNKDGLFKIKLSPDTKILTVFSEKYGMVSKEYNGNEPISFKFSENAGPLSEKELAEMGFKLNTAQKRNATNYADYATIYDILKAKFPQVRVTSDQRIIISKGINTYSGNTDPLVLVDGQPRSNIGTIPTSEIKSIRVVQKGDEASEYGLRGVNGVLLVALKD